jgi:hypothetical protein
MQGDLVGARLQYERALLISERALGADHPDTAASLNSLGGLLYAQKDPAGARPYCERAVAIYEGKLGLSHPTTRVTAQNLALLFDQLNLPNEAIAIRQKFGLSDKS